MSSKRYVPEQMPLREQLRLALGALLAPIIIAIGTVIYILQTLVDKTKR
jgi:hypothetical protein